MINELLKILNEEFNKDSLEFYLGDDDLEDRAYIIGVKVKGVSQNLSKYIESITIDFKFELNEIIDVIISKEFGYDIYFWSDPEFFYVRFKNQ